MIRGIKYNRRRPRQWLGNIRTKTLGSRNIINTYNNATNMVTQTADSVKGTRAISHDARGNVISLGAQNFTYFVVG
ncbi:MAG: hypothetical protein L3J04_00165 [Robiginitomaculum sp.]|nr:hypothetical protein [Robiginitomaculum sp.]